MIKAHVKPSKLWFRKFGKKNIVILNSFMVLQIQTKVMASKRNTSWWNSGNLSIPNKIITYDLVRVHKNMQQTNFDVNMMAPIKYEEAHNLIITIIIA